MNIRGATKDDIDIFMGFVSEYEIYQMGLMGFVYDPEVFKKHALDLIAGGSCLCMEVDGVVVGGLGGRIVPSFYSKDIIFDLMTIHIEPEYRKYTAELFDHLEKILQLTSATKMVVCNPAMVNYPKYDRFYKMKGYRLLQLNYIKDIIREAAHVS